MDQPQNMVHPDRPTTASAVSIRAARRFVALFAIVVLVVTGTIIIRVLAVCLGLAVVDLVEYDAGDLLVRGELLGGVLDHLARRRSPADHQDDRIAELRDD